MIEKNNWSSLITVNYNPGMGGDFLSLLIDNNFIDTGSKDLSYSNEFRFNFLSRDPFKGKFKTLSYFYSEPNFNLKAIEDNKWIRESYDLFNSLYNKDKKVISQNIKNYCYDYFNQEFFRKRVFSTHCVHSSFIPIQDTFPKSKNIFLSSKNKNYLLISRFFFIYKSLFFNYNLKDNDITVTNLMLNRQSLKDFAADNLHIDYIENHFDEFFLDIYELVFNDRNFNNELSDLIGSKIELNKDHIQMYKNGTIKILENLNIDISLDYEFNELYNILFNLIISLLEKKNVSN